MIEDDYNGKKCDYFNQFVKFAITDLKTNGVCYAYHKDQVELIRKRINEDLIIEEKDFGYIIRLKKKKGDVL